MSKKKNNDVLILARNYWQQMARQFLQKNISKDHITLVSYADGFRAGLDAIRSEWKDADMAFKRSVGKLTNSSKNISEAAEDAILSTWNNGDDINYFAAQRIFYLGVLYERNAILSTEVHMTEGDHGDLDLSDGSHCFDVGVNFFKLKIKNRE